MSSNRSVRVVLAFTNISMSGPDRNLSSIPQFLSIPTRDSHQTGGGDPRLNCVNAESLQRQHEDIELVLPHQGEH